MFYANPRSVCKLEVLSEHVILFQNLIDKTWVYHQQHGRDAQNLSHNRVTVQKVFFLKNDANLIKYEKERRVLRNSLPIGRSLLKIHEVAGPALNILCRESNVCHTQVDGRPKPILTEGFDLSSMGETSCDSSVNEIYLFHGTNLDSSEGILQNGFDFGRAYEGSLYGKAVYFAESAEKADHYADSSKDRRKQGLTVLLSRVLLGRSYIQQRKWEKIEELPCTRAQCMRQGCKLPGHVPFDSVVAGFDKRFREFLIWNPKRCLPMYLIEYDRVDTDGGA